MRRVIKTCKHNIIVRILHQYDWLSHRKSICDWLSRRKSTCWWIIVCSNLAAYIVREIVRKRKYKLLSSNQSILPYLYC